MTMSKQEIIEIPDNINPDNYTRIKIVFSNGLNTEVPLDGQPHELITEQNKITFTINETYAALVDEIKLQADPDGLMRLSYDFSYFGVTAQIVNNNLSLHLSSDIKNIKITNEKIQNMWVQYDSKKIERSKVYQGDLTDGFDKISISEIYLLP